MPSGEPGQSQLGLRMDQACQDLLGGLEGCDLMTLVVQGVARTVSHDSSLQTRRPAAGHG